MRASILLASVVVFLAVGCVNNTSSKIEPPQNGEIIRDQDLVSQINSSPSTLTINGVEYTVEPYAWRDFMPIVNLPVRLNANNTLIREDGNTIQDDFEIVQHYIVRDKEIWIPHDIEVRQNQSSPNRLHVVSREGPEWEIDSKVNVGLKIKNQKTGDIFWLTVPKVEIVQTQ
ncbi:MAG: hypothetical protein U5K69_21690 [Balneolaceae bacterium]|nr:hypothetical protein [Balneolaceae bacterium]